MDPQSVDIGNAALPAEPPPRWIAAALLLWLSLLVLGTGFASAVLLSSSEDYADSTAFQIVLCMTGGALGAAMTALLAAGERIARGWSHAVDALARGERGFHARLAPLLAVQPILGAALGMLLLLALSAGSVMLLRVAEGTIFDPMGLLLVSVVAGLFARTLLGRVRDSVEALFGRKETVAAAERERPADRPSIAPAARPVVVAAPMAVTVDAGASAREAAAVERAADAGPAPPARDAQALAGR